MSKRKRLSFVSKLLLGTFVLSRTAVATPTYDVNATTDWSAVRRDLQNEVDHSESTRLLALKTAAQLNAGASLNETILASYLSASEVDYPKLDTFWLHHDLIQQNTQATEEFLELRTGLTAQRAVLSGTRNGSWKDYLTLAYD